MIKSNNLILSFVGISNIIAILFFYSSISLYGYWSDNLLLLLISLGSLFFLKFIKNKLIKKTFKKIIIINLVFVCLTSFSLFHGIVPVKILSAGHFGDENTYAYFIERGNLGSTNGCYGEIQYYKQIKWLPFLEIKIETDNCSSLTYKNIIYGT